MPQFDLAPYLSQAFWMLISFGIMYLLVSYLIMPMLDDVFEERDRLIQTNLEAAERINKQAELLIKEYDEFMLSADQRKAAMLKAVYEDMNRTTSKIEGEHDKLVRKQIRKTEDDLERLRTQLHAQSDNIATLVADKLAKKLGVGRVAKR
ncbi:MAG: hypothetical protein IKY98_01765 [Alphaproteobacteria bacterium]|nr:hypothetical protein [Alphaproteobacteria bacterium]